MENLIDLIIEMTPYEKIILLIIVLWLCIGITAALTSLGLILSGIVTIILVVYITKALK